MTDIKLKVPTKEDLLTCLEWRNEALEALRTPFFLTKEMQEDFYYNTISNRKSKDKYFAIKKDMILLDGHTAYPRLLGVGGINDVHPENSIGEISLILDPDHRNKGYGKKCVELLLDYAFKTMNLNYVIGECYECNPSLIFWIKIALKYNATKIFFPKRKYFDGKYFDSFYFLIDKRRYLQ